MLSAVLVGILTYAFTMILVGLAGMIPLISRRNHILRFYGIRQPQDTIRIIVPRLDVKAGGATSAVAVSRGYAGPAVTQSDYEAAVLLQEQIRSSIFTWFSRKAPDWMTGKFVRTAAVNPVIELASASDDASSWLESHSRTNLILLGGPAYNAVSKECQEWENAHFAFVRGQPGAGWSVLGARGGTENYPDTFESRAKGRELAFIQRIVRKDTGAYITMCAGTGAGATLAGAEWLNSNYQRLDRCCPKGEYGILLEHARVTNPNSRFSAQTIMEMRDKVIDGKRDL
jgi:hypothetical protein